MDQQTKKPGQIAEYGTPEFENNKSVRTILESAVIVNPHGFQRKIELYHRSEGYKQAGSCATWTLEVWGYTIYNDDDGTTGGQSSTDKDYILNEKWTKLNLIRRQIIGQ